MVAVTVHVYVCVCLYIHILTAMSVCEEGITLRLREVSTQVGSMEERFASELRDIGNERSYNGWSMLNQQ